jgi:hypothetical protein
MTKRRRRAEGMADRARLLDPDPQQPDPVAARAAIAPYLEDIDSYMRSLEVSRGFSIPLACVNPSSILNAESLGSNLLSLW